MTHRLARRPLVQIVLGTTDLTLGLVLVTEPNSRVSSTSFVVATQWMPMPVWGVILTILGTLIVGRSTFDRHAGYAMSLAASWYAFFVVALTWAAVTNPKAALTGIVVYTGLAVTLHLLCSWRKIR